MLGRNITSHRESKGMTREELASAVGVSRNYIVRIEQGSKRPSVRLLAKIAYTLGVGLDKLVNYSPLKWRASRF